MRRSEAALHWPVTCQSGTIQAWMDADTKQAPVYWTLGQTG